MKKKDGYHRLNQRCWRMLAALLGMVLVFALSSPVRAMPIDDTHKWAWSTNAGWLNHKATHGQATVYADHLEGYAWAENAGWVRLGTYSGGDAHTYLNTTQNNYGVNNDGAGNLSGFGWSATAGWINFNPTHGGVTIDPATGDFSGYAWSENAGWIKFAGTAQDSTVYKVKTDPTTYAVTYNGNGATSGTAPDPQTKTHDVALTLSTNTGNLTRTGYTFSGWNTAADGTGTTYAEGASYTDNAAVTLYARWTQGPTFTVTYNGNGNTGGSVPTDPNAYQQGDKVTVLGAGTLEKTGYTFTAWNTAANGSGTSYAPGAKFTMPGANVTLYAQWTQGQTHILTVATNPAAGGTVTRTPDKALYDPDESVQVTAAANAGYGFTGWSGDLSGTTNPASITMDRNKTVTANFSSSCAATIDPTARQHGPEAVNGQNVTVAIGEGCPWTATSNAAWITITGGAKGTGDGTVTYSITENGYPKQPRTGTMTIAGETCTITQGSFDSTFTDGPGAGCGIEVERDPGGPYILYMNSPEAGGTLPPDTTFPWGLFDFKVVNVPLGGMVRIHFTMTGNIPAGSTFYKYDAGAGTYTPYANVEGLDDEDNLFTLILTDGGEGDQDGVVNGEIVDPGNVGVVGAPPIPTLSEWGMILLISLLAGITLWRMRRERIV